jgi:hypothetical protein
LVFLSFLFLVVVLFFLVGGSCGRVSRREVLTGACDYDRYWWAIGLFLILQMAMAGGKEESAPKK